MKIYTEEHIKFFMDFVPGHTTAEVAAEFNRRFGFDMQITPGKVDAIKKRLRLRSGTPSGNRIGSYRTFPAAVRDFLRANNVGKTAEEMTALLNKEFGTDYTTEQIKGIRARMHLKSGLTGRFESGFIPWNKGKKGWHAEGSEKTWFKKGNIPSNHVAVGTEVMASNGYLKVKVAEPNKWRWKHIMEWEKHRGKVPTGCCIAFKDGNSWNCSIENLMCITRAEHAIMNHEGLRSSSPELTKSGLALAKLKHKVNQIQKEAECAQDGTAAGAARKRGGKRR